MEAYETGARAGHEIRDILEDMKTRSSFALLVLTADDQIGDDLFRARQNVIHETGYVLPLLVEARTESEEHRRKATSLLDEALAISSDLGMRPLMERVLSRRKILRA